MGGFADRYPLRSEADGFMMSSLAARASWNGTFPVIALHSNGRSPHSSPGNGTPVPWGCMQGAGRATHRATCVLYPSSISCQQGCLSPPAISGLLQLVARRLAAPKAETPSDPFPNFQSVETDSTHLVVHAATSSPFPQYAASSSMPSSVHTVLSTSKHAASADLHSFSTSARGSGKRDYTVSDEKGPSDVVPPLLQWRFLAGKILRSGLSLKAAHAQWPWVILLCSAHPVTWRGRGVVRRHGLRFSN